MRRCAAAASTVNIALCTSDLRTRTGMVSTVPAIVCWDSGLPVMPVTVVRLSRQLGADLASQVHCRVVGVLTHQGQHRDLHGVRATGREKLDHAAGEESHTVRPGRAHLTEARF